jgi:hypothetical protein
MRVEILEFWAAIVLIVAYITAAILRRGAGGDGLYRRGLFHLSIAFFLMEVGPPILHLLNNQNKELSNTLLAVGIIIMIIAVLLFLNSLRLLCNWLLGDRAG